MMLIVKWLARWIEPMVLRCQQRTHSMDLRYLLYVWKKPYIRDPPNLCEKQGFDFMLGREDDLGLGDSYQNFQSIFIRLNVRAVASCYLRWRCCTFTHQKNTKKLLTSLALPGATGQAEYREAQATLKMDRHVLNCLSRLMKIIVHQSNSQLFGANLGFSAFERWLQQIVSGKISQSAMFFGLALSKKVRDDAFLNVTDEPSLPCLLPDFKKFRRWEEEQKTITLRGEARNYCCLLEHVTDLRLGGRSQKRRIFNAGSLERSWISSPKHQ